MAVHKSFESPVAAKLNNIAKTKNDDALWNLADISFSDGSHGDWMWTVNAAIEVAQSNPKTDVWMLCPIETVYWFFGTEADGTAKISALPDK